MINYRKLLNPERALIWRIVHLHNIPWILDHGLYSGNHRTKYPDWVSIGDTALIQKRASHPVPQPPHGHLNDYVPFYFTPCSPMLFNVLGGRSVRQQRPQDIVILVSSLPRLHDLGLPFVFSDMHAFYGWANFYTSLSHLDRIDWRLLQARDFRRDQDDPQKFERYQAEALVYQHCPVTALSGMACYNQTVAQQLNAWLDERNLSMKIQVVREFYQ